MESIEQPIIDQPEIGILGFLVQRQDGCHRFLVQGKLEPGNIGGVQLSPTLQATLSNYSCVHGGKEPAFLQWFVGNPTRRVIVDELQSEQGTRFLRKKNRNMVVEVPEGHTIDHDETFRWVGCAELAELLTGDNVLNTDARSVLSCLPLEWLEADEQLRADREATEFGRHLTVSARSLDVSLGSSVDRACAWFDEIKARYPVTSETIALEQLADWSLYEDRLDQPDGAPFSVIQMHVETNCREVEMWDQPIVSSRGEGLIGFLCQRRAGVLHFLVQARAEAGLFDGIELTTTVQCDPGFDFRNGCRTNHQFLEFFDAPDPGMIRASVRQSEEGGRFFQDQNRYVVLEADESESLTIPDNYCWMTLGQMKAMPRFNHFFTNEARSLIACLML
jgi:oxidase EvaA